MSVQRYRLPAGGRIDRSQIWHFTFDGRRYEGHPGDTLASALLANGVRLVGRSFKYHRPRGILGSGAEESNALVQLESGALTEPNLKATQIELYDGLAGASQNCWPSLRHDLGALAGTLAPILPAGFYYKTLMWPRWSWYETAIRGAAGLGRAPTEPDPSRYGLRYDHTDVLVIGGGPAGLAAATAALERGRRVILVDERPELGGTLMDGDAGEEKKRLELLAGLTAASALGDLTVLTRTTAVGMYDHGVAAVVERLTDHLGPRPSGPLPRQRLRLVRATATVLAAGAIERPLLFPDNDRPGIMLASGVRAYCNRFAVLAGREALVYAAHDTAWETAFALAKARACATVVDLRTDVPGELLERARHAGIEAHLGHAITATHGRQRLRAVDIAALKGGRSRRIHCDLLAMSGGWTPSVHIHAHDGGKLRFEVALGAFVPDRPTRFVFSAGGVNGLSTFDECVTEGAEVAVMACVGRWLPRTLPPTAMVPAAAHQTVNARRVWVDFQNDVTAADIELAARENLVSVEHVKRYTTLGMAVDQGKTANLNGLALLARTTGRVMPEVGTTRYRPPYTPTTVGVFAGGSVGECFRPRRLLPAHDCHLAAGARMTEYGAWQRPSCYVRPGESDSAAIRREVLVVRNAVGVFDASPLGKIELAGPDADRLVDRVYANAMRNLKPGRARYGLMLNEEGVIIDDGVAARLDAQRWLLNTTSAGADRIADWLEQWHQCEWPELRVVIAPVTTAWATLTVTGPLAKEVVTALGTDVDLNSFPHLSIREGHVAGVAARLARVSFTGEASYEISVAWNLGAALWERIIATGAAFQIAPVGVEAWMVLRTEKGFLHVGTDTDGSTIPQDIGFGAAVARRTEDFIGKRALSFLVNRRSDRPQLVGVEPAEPGQPLLPGTHLLDPDQSVSIGFITSACDSPTLDRWIGLALVKGGQSRLGQVFVTEDLGRRGRVRVLKPGHYDPHGLRFHG